MKKLLLIIFSVLLLVSGTIYFLVDNGNNVEAVSYNLKDDVNVDSSINSYLKDGNLIIEYDNPNNEKVWIEGIVHDRYLITNKEVIIYNYQPNELFKLHIGEFSDVYEFGSNSNNLIGEFCDSSYENGVMTDTSCLQFKTETNGVITVNDDRYLAFALKGTLNENEITKTSMDFGWVWNVEENNGDYIFTATNDNSDFIWKQYYYFYKDKSKSMKIEHYLENNLADISNMQMYYLTNVNPTDEIEYNETRYLVSEKMGLHKQGNFNDLISTINFNAEYDFKFQDLVDTGFTINEFYIGSGSVIEKPEIDIMAIGFTKNNGYFPLGSSVLIDPEFGTGDSVEIPVSTPLTSNTFALAWCDETADDIHLQMFNTTGENYTGVIDVDTSVGACNRGSVSISALNSTNLVISYFDDSVNEIFAVVYDSSGNVINSPIQVDSNTGTYSAITVTALSSTTFVVAWNEYQSSSGNVQLFSTYYTNGTLIASVGYEPFNNPVAARLIPTVSALTSDTFVIGYNDYPTRQAQFVVYYINGTQITAPTSVGGSVGEVWFAPVSALTSDTFVMGFHDTTDDDVTFVVY